MASVVWSPDVDRYATGGIAAHEIRCALCRQVPCECPEFGTEEYVAEVNARHGRAPGGGRR